MTDLTIGAVAGIAIGWASGYGAGYVRCLWRYRRVRQVTEAFGKERDD